MNKAVGSRPVSKQFLGNTNKTEVHDLRREKPNCQVDEIIRAGHAVIFEPDTLATAHQDRFDNCAWCIGDSKR